MNRRLIVLTFYISFAVAVALSGLAAPGWGRPAFVVTVLVFLASLGALAVVSKPYYVEGAHWAAPANVDERQSRVRDHALAYSYWITSALMVGVTLWTAAAQIWPAMWHPKTHAQWVLTLWFIVIPTSMLPAAIIAWNEPPAPPAE